MFLANKLINFYNLLYGVNIYNQKQHFSKKERDIMQLLTNVTLKVAPLINENEAKFNAECQAIREKYDLKLEYDGRDVLVTFPLYSQIEMTKWCQLILGLFHEQSNFKPLLFKEFSFLRCKKKLECIFFEVNGVTICVKKNSNPYELMRSYFREQGYVVFDNDTEQQIKSRDEKLLKLRMFVYQIFLQESNNSDLKAKRRHIFFLSKEEEQAYNVNEEKIYNKRFKEYLQDFELDSESSEDSKKLLILLKKQLLH